MTLSMLVSRALSGHILTKKHCAKFGGDEFGLLHFKFCNYQEGSTVLLFYYLVVAGYVTLLLKKLSPIEILCRDLKFFEILTL